MTGERAHRTYSPSSAPRLFRCRGSANLLRRVPRRPDTVYSIEGTKAHTVFQAALENRIRDAKEAHRDWSVLLAEELDDGENNFYFSVQVALDYVYAILDEHPDATVWVETFVDPPIESAPGEAGGYCDVAIYIPSQDLLYVIDFKHGAGVAVEPDSEQLLSYGAGFLFDTLRSHDIPNVTLVVLQPRAFHKDGPTREYETTAFRIWEYLQELDQVVAEAEKEDAPLTPGQKQCQFCDASTVCPAREASALSVADASFRQIRDVTSKALPLPDTIDSQRLGLIRAHAPALRAWLDAVETHCYELARSGHYIPGAKLVEASPRRKWYGDTFTTAKRVAGMLGDNTAEAAVAAYQAVLKAHPVLDTLFKSKMIPLTDAEKLIVEAYKRRAGHGRKKHAAETAHHDFAYLTTKESSGSVSLVDESDPRPAVNATRKAFNQIMPTVQAALMPPK